MALEKVIKLTQAQYDTLANGGTVGSYTGLDPDYIYLVEDGTVYASQSWVENNYQQKGSYVTEGSLGNAAYKNYTTSVTSGSSNLVTSGAVYSAIAALPTPMQFIGTVGSGGTYEWANLPAASGHSGWTLKAITTNAQMQVKDGDTIISNGSTWIIIPSGDEPSGTVTNVATGTGLTGGPITSTGTISINTSWLDSHSLPLSGGNLSGYLNISHSSQPGNMPALAVNYDNSNGEGDLGENGLNCIKFGTIDNYIGQIPANHSALGVSAFGIHSKSGHGFEFMTTGWEWVATLTTAGVFNARAGLQVNGTNVCLTNDSRLSDARPASDVYSWAKQSSKPSYNFNEIGNRYDTLLNFSGNAPSLVGNVSPVGMAMSNEHSANRLAFINANALYCEYSTDGTNWSEQTYMDSNARVAMVTKSYGMPVGRNNTGDYEVNSKTRLTITGTNASGTQYLYCSPKKMLINISSSGGMEVLIECRSGTNTVNNGSWQTYGTYALSGWSGWNEIPLVMGTLGGGSTQYDNFWQLRLTFKMTSKNSSYPTTAYINAIRLYADNIWYGSSNMSTINELYDFDMGQNAYFPNNIYEAGTALVNKYYPLSGNPSGFLTGITSSMVTNALGYTPPASDTNYYQTPDFSSGRKISTGTGVGNLYVPVATSGNAGVVYIGDSEQNTDAMYLSGTVAPQKHTHSNYLPLSGGSLSGPLYFGDVYHRISQEDGSTITRAGGGTISVPIGSGTKGMAILADEGGDFGLLYVGSDGSVIANSGDNGYIFKVYDKDANATDFTSSSGLIFGVRQGSGAYVNGVLDVSSYITEGGTALSDKYQAKGNYAGTSVATQSANGLMSATDKTNLDGIVASLNNDDSDSVVNRLKDVLSVFQDYPEGTTVLSALNSKLSLSGGDMTGSPYITMPASPASLSDSQPFGITYGRIQSYDTIKIAADTDGTTTEYVFITAGYGVANCNAANGLAIGYNSLTWKNNAIIHAGNIGSQSVNYANSAGSAGSVAWSNVSGRPTDLGDFSNNAGYITLLDIPTASTSRFGLCTIGNSEQYDSSGSLIMAGTVAPQGHTHSNYLTGITSSMVVNALGYTPYNSSNPNGYITSSGSCASATSAGSSTVSDNVTYLTTAPSSANTSGRLKFVVLSSEPATKYDGYIYIITE